MKNMNDIELIETYLKQELPKGEKSRFQQRMEEDSDFKILVSQMELLIGGIKRTAKQTTEQEKLDLLKKRVAEKGRLVEVVEKRPAKVVKMFTRLKRVAGNPVFGILFLLAVTASVLIATQRPTSEAIFADYFVPYESSGSSRGDDGSLDTWGRGERAYVNQNYDLAISELEEMEKPSELSNFYLANAYLSRANDSDLERAIMILNDIADGDKIYKIRAKWYLGLVYIRSNNILAGKDIMEELSKPASAYNDHREDAEEILKKLKKIKQK